jgi:hypothetical protein
VGLRVYGDAGGVDWLGGLWEKGLLELGWIGTGAGGRLHLVWVVCQCLQDTWYEVLAGGMCYDVVTYTTLAMTVAFG